MPNAICCAEPPDIWTKEFASIKPLLEWNSPQTIDRVVLFDRPNKYDYITTGKLTVDEAIKPQGFRIARSGEKLLCGR